MGLWGSLILARTERSLLDLKAIQERSAGLDGEEQRGPWRIGIFPGADFEDAAPEFHVEWPKRRQHRC